MLWSVSNVQGGRTVRTIKEMIEIVRDRSRIGHQSPLFPRQHAHPSAPLIIGFTGTRDGMTEYQKASFRGVLPQLFPVGAFVHGDCVGADATAHDMVRAFDPKIRIYVFPGPGDARAHCDGDVVEPVMAHLKRNDRIVATADIMIACPREMTEQERGGTWYTIRESRRRGIDVIILWPEVTP